MNVLLPAVLRKKRLKANFFECSPIETPKVTDTVKNSGSTYMALIEASFFSPVIQKQVQLKAIVPDAGTGPFPVFYLLHGYSDDHSIWLRRTRIEMYVREMPLIVVMPDGLNGFNTDHEE